ncbi:Uncharacterised protein [Vibrio cholerae]|nr:Uncharacterised protein [Vibrio cholerae]
MVLIVEEMICQQADWVGQVLRLLRRKTSKQCISLKTF